MSSSPAPSWKEIYDGLETIFVDLDEINRIATMSITQRLEYEEFEFIFAKLMARLDRSAFRRDFRSIHPANDKPDRERFFERTASFFNGKKMIAQRIVANQLKMLGGEPFRRILASIIKVTIDIDCEEIARKLSIDSEIKEAQSFSGLTNLVMQGRSRLRKRIEDLKVSATNYIEMRNDIQEREKNIDERWEILTQDMSDSPKHFDRAHIDTVNRLLLDRLERANARFRAAYDRVTAMPKPQSPIRRDNSARFSQRVRELREYLDPNQGNGSCQAQLAQQISLGFDELDDRMTSLLSDLRDKKDQADEEFLQQPEILEQYKFYETLIPFIDLKPIGHHELNDETYDADLGEIDIVVQKYK